jgi:phospholipid/cholesterol/gamma-HCH transport system substrate-binding protein
MRAHWGETLMGFAVLAFAGLFLAYALGVTGAGQAGGAYELSARFGEAGGIAPGAKVTVSGVKVGQVASVTIDPKTFLAVIKLSVAGDVKLPSDSTAKITSDGLLGGNHISIMPGGAADDLKAGGEISNTQGAVDLFGLIGQVMRPKSDAPAAASSAPAAPKGAANLPEM